MSPTPDAASGSPAAPAPTAPSGGAQPRRQRLYRLEQLLSVAIFVLVLFQMYQSTKVGVTPRGTAAREALQHLHISTGLTVLLLLVPRLWLWFRMPRPLRPARVPIAADALARHCTLALYLTLVGFSVTGPLFAWAEGHAVSWFGLVTLPALVPAGYRLTVTVGYLHSLLGFLIILLAVFTVLVGLWQGLRYRIGPWRLLPAAPWGGDGATGQVVTTTGWRMVHGLLFGALFALAAYMPYRVFGVVPFTTSAQLVESGPPPAIDPYAGVGEAPQLSAQGTQDFMWCRFCHSFEEGGPHGVGPNLHRVFGRRAASAAGFYYSPALVEAGRGGLVWDAASIEQLIADPAQFLDGAHRMRYKPIVDPQERRQIVDALKAATR